jgi:hypothetical protein
MTIASKIHRSIYRDSYRSIFGLRPIFAYFDGVNKYFRLTSPYSLSIGESFSFSFVIYERSSIYAAFVDSVSEQNRICIRRSNAIGSVFEFIGCTVKIDGVEIPNGSEITPFIDGEKHVLELTATVDGNIKNIGCNYLMSVCIKAFIFDLSAQGFDIGLHDGYLKGGVISTGQYFNFTEDSWHMEPAL